MRMKMEMIKGLGSWIFLSISFSAFLSISLFFL